MNHSFPLLTLMALLALPLTLAAEEKSPAERRAACEAEIKKDEALDEPKLTEQYKKDCRAIQVPAAPLRALNDSSTDTSTPETPPAADTARGNETPPAAQPEAPQETVRIGGEPALPEYPTQAPQIEASSLPEHQPTSEAQQVANREQLRQEEQHGLQASFERDLGIPDYPTQAPTIEASDLPEHQPTSAEQQAANREQLAREDAEGQSVTAAQEMLAHETRHETETSDGNLLAGAANEDELKQAIRNEFGGLMNERAVDELASLRGREAVVAQTGVDGRYSSPFGWRRHPVTGEWKFHSGGDMAAAAGTPVRSAAAGTVTFAGRSGGYGNLVIVDHGNGVTTRYAHLTDGVAMPTVGARVNQGDLVGGVGTTGMSTGNHLHYEVRVNNRAIDPAGEGYDVIASINNGQPMPTWTGQIPQSNNAPSLTGSSGGYGTATHGNFYANQYQQEQTNPYFYSPTPMYNPNPVPAQMPEAQGSGGGGAMPAVQAPNVMPIYPSVTVLPLPTQPTDPLPGLMERLQRQSNDCVNLRGLELLKRSDCSAALQ